MTSLRTQSQWKELLETSLHISDTDVNRLLRRLGFPTSTYIILFPNTAEIYTSRLRSGGFLSHASLTSAFLNPLLHLLHLLLLSLIACPFLVVASSSCFSTFFSHPTSIGWIAMAFCADTRDPKKTLVKCVCVCVCVNERLLCLTVKSVISAFIYHLFCFL